MAISGSLREILIDKFGTSLVAQNQLCRMCKQVFSAHGMGAACPEIRHARLIPTEEQLKQLHVPGAFVPAAPSPRVNEEDNLFAWVKRDLDARNALGYKIHNRPLMPTDDADWIKEAYEEALDLAVYLKGELLKRDRDRAIQNRS